MLIKPLLAAALFLAATVSASAMCCGGKGNESAATGKSASAMQCGMGAMGGMEAKAGAADDHAGMGHGPAQSKAPNHDQAMGEQAKAGHKSGCCCGCCGGAKGSDKT
jgi:hypothetical protein